MKWSIVLLLLTAATLLAQEPAPAAVPVPVPAQATVTYLFDWPQGVPWTKFSIDVQSDGRAHFNGTPHPDANNSDTDPVLQDFNMVPGNRERIFELTQKLNYFQGDMDAHIKRIAQTGQKTLRYQSPQAHSTATFNYSQNPDVKELLQLFTGIATTIDYGRKLEFQYRFDKLGMAQCLKELEQGKADHQIAELHLINPILQKIADDPNVMNIARESAQRLLKSQTAPAAPVYVSR
jgi:hypothetical protein